jgi:DNA processing protein
MNPEYLELLAAIQLSRKPQVGAASFAKHIQKYQTPQKALIAIFGENGSPSLKAPQKNAKKNFQPPSEESLKHLHYCYYQGPSYPKNLLSLTEPPPYLFVKGNKKLLEEKILTVVGTRNPSSEGLQFTERVVQSALQNAYHIASGGALGIDAQAHRTCLALGGKGILVVAHGVDVVYPKAHRSLFEEILDKEGCILSEFLPSTSPRSSFFPTRNRILAGLAQEVVWVEGSAKSGARFTAQHTLKLQKKLWIWYGKNPLLQQGPHSLISQGASFLNDPESAFKER